MNLMRILARPMLATPFIVAGIDAASSPEAHRERATQLFNLAGKVGVRLELPSRVTDTVTRSMGVAMTAAGCALACGTMPRLSAALLATMQAPLAVSNYPFWEKEGAERRAAFIGLAGAVGLAGGAILTATKADKGSSGRACISPDARSRADRIPE